MKYNLFLDDIRKPTDVTIFSDKKLKWKIVKNHKEFIKYVTKHGIPDLVSFDHDLAPEHYAKYNENLKFETETGFETLVWFCDYIKINNLEIPEVNIHTSNFVAYKNMTEYFNEFNKTYNPL